MKILYQRLVLIAAIGISTHKSYSQEEWEKIQALCVRWDSYQGTVSDKVQAGFKEKALNEKEYTSFLKAISLVSMTATLLEKVTSFRLHTSENLLPASIIECRKVRASLLTYTQALLFTEKKYSTAFVEDLERFLGIPYYPLSSFSFKSKETYALNEKPSLSIEKVPVSIALGTLKPPPSMSFVQGASGDSRKKEAIDSRILTLENLVLQGEEIYYAWRAIKISPEEDKIKVFEKELYESLREGPQLYEEPEREIYNSYNEYFKRMRGILGDERSENRVLAQKIEWAHKALQKARETIIKPMKRSLKTYSHLLSLLPKDREEETSRIKEAYQRFSSLSASQEPILKEVFFDWNGKSRYSDSLTNPRDPWEKRTYLGFKGEFASQKGIKNLYDATKNYSKAVKAFLTLPFLSDQFDNGELVLKKEVPDFKSYIKVLFSLLEPQNLIDKALHDVPSFLNPTLNHDAWMAFTPDTSHFLFLLFDKIIQSHSFSELDSEKFIKLSWEEQMKIERITVPHDWTQPIPPLQFQSLLCTLSLYNTKPLKDFFETSPPLLYTYVSTSSEELASEKNKEEFLTCLMENVPSLGFIEYNDCSEKLSLDFEKLYEKCEKYHILFQHRSKFGMNCFEINDFDDEQKEEIKKEMKFLRHFPYIDIIHGKSKPKTLKNFLSLLSGTLLS